MSIRKDEHSYRSLIHDVVTRAVAQKADAVMKELVKVRLSHFQKGTPQQTALTVGIAELVDYRRAIQWLEDIPADNCPDAESIIEELTDKVIAGQDPRAVLDNLIAAMEASMPRPK